MSALSFLDNVVNTAGNLAGKAIDYAGQAKVAKATAGARDDDQTPVSTTSAIQNAAVGGVPVVWIGVGLAALVGAYLIFRK